MGPQYHDLRRTVADGGLHTVCQEAGCPNIYECWEDREATFLIGGDQCTRRCDFCQIDTGRPQPLDRSEPAKVADTVVQMGLRYATVTGVARDDLEDRARGSTPRRCARSTTRCPAAAWRCSSRTSTASPICWRRSSPPPEVLAHNLETVPRLMKRIRPAFRYDRSLDVLTQARAAGLVTKSNLILGMGERTDEVLNAMHDLHEAGCDLLTITRYLRPSARHHPVERWVPRRSSTSWPMRRRRSDSWE